jgi:hypothetical protein
MKAKKRTCTKNVSCQKCSDYVIGDPFGSCRRFGYGVNGDLAKKQAVCK